MSSIRQLLLSHRLLPEQFIRLDADLFARLEALATQQGCSVRALVVESLYAALQENHLQTQNHRQWHRLTPREQQVAALACLGYTNDEIAGNLVISVNTVRSHMRSILDKYQVSSKAELRLILANWDFDAWLEAQWSPSFPLIPED